MSTSTKMTFEVNGVILSGVATESGNIYTPECLMLIERQILTNKLTIQEMNVPERERDGIPMYEPIKSRTMANIIDAKIVGNSLNIKCETKVNRDGKKLYGVIQALGVDNINFIPVGLGHTRVKDGYQEVYNYLLKYITIEPIK